MKLLEKDFMVGGARCGATLHYDEVETELQVTPETPKLTRVLPSPFFYEKRLFFYLIKRYEPGEKRTFPRGGYEVRGEDGAMRSYNLDQVIIHPAVIKHKKTLEKMARKAEKEQRKRERRSKKVERIDKLKHTRRGRPALSPEEKARRMSEQTERSLRSGNKRGRPKGITTTTNNYVPTGGKRGRRPLDPAVKEAREREAAARKLRTGGKKGRPKRS